MGGCMKSKFENPTDHVWKTYFCTLSPQCSLILNSALDSRVNVWYPFTSFHFQTMTPEERIEVTIRRRRRKSLLEVLKKKRGNLKR